MGEIPIMFSGSIWVLELLSTILFAYYGGNSLARLPF